MVTYLRQDPTTNLMRPIEGVQAQPATQGQPVEVSAGGRIDPSLLPTTYDPKVDVIAAEAVQAGDLCYLLWENNARVIRKAVATAMATLSTVFVKDSYAQGASAAAYIHGVMTLVNPGTYTAADVGTSIYLSPTIPGYFQKSYPTATGQFTQRVAVITDVTETTLSCFFIGYLDRGRTAGSGLVDTDPTVSAHLTDHNNPHQVNATQVGAVATTQVGVASGVAPLGANSLVPDAYLPTSTWKSKSVRVVMTSNVNLASPGATLDGLTMTAGDRALLTAQTDLGAPGVYVWNSATTAMTRATDADTAAELCESIWVVAEGTQAHSVWMNTNKTIPTLGSTLLTFVRILDPGWTNPLTTSGDLLIAATGGSASRLAAGANGLVLTMVAGVPKWSDLTVSGMTNPMTDTGDIVYLENGKPARLAIAPEGQVLTSYSGRPAWKAPVTGFANPMQNMGDLIIGGSGGAAIRLGMGSSGQVLTMVSDSIQWVNGLTNPMTTHGDLLWGTDGGQPRRLALGVNGQVLTVVSGAMQWAAPTTGFANPMLADGDLIIGGTTGAATRLAQGSTGQVLTITTEGPRWSGASGLTNPMTTVGDLIVGGTTGAAGRMGVGTNGQVLTVVAGVPAWTAPSSWFSNPMTTAGDLIYGSTGGVGARLAPGTENQVLTMRSGFPTWVTGSGGSYSDPMTTLGDMLVRGASATERLAKGANGQVLTMVAGVPAWVNGAGLTNPMSAAGDLVVGASGGSPSRLAKGSDGQVLTMVSGVPAWANNAAGFANPMSAAGDLIVGGTGGAAQRLAKGTDGQVLKLVSGMPAWAAEGGSGGGMVNPMTTQGDLITGGATGTPGRLAKGGDTQVLTMVSGSPAWADAPTGSGGSIFQISTSFSEIIIPKADAATATYNPGDGYPYQDKSYQWQGDPWEASVPATPGATYYWDVWGGPLWNTYVDGTDSPTVTFRASVYTSIYLRCTKKHADGKIEVAEKRIPVRYHAFKGTSAVGDVYYPTVPMPAPGGSIDGVLGTLGVGIMGTWGNAGLLALETGELLFTDQHCLRKISADRTTLSTVCGGGSTGYTTPDFLEQTGTDARTGFEISNLCRIDDDVYFICNNSNRIAKVNLTTHYMSLVAGSGNTLWPLLDSSPARAGAINCPSRMAAGDSCLYIVDSRNGGTYELSRNGGTFELVRMINPGADTITTVFDASASPAFSNRGPIMGLAVQPGNDSPDTIFIAFEDEILMVTGINTADHVAGAPKSQQDPWVKHRVGPFTDYDNAMLHDATFYSIYRMIWDRFGGKDQLIVGDGQGLCAIRTVDPTAIDARKVVTRYLMGTQWSYSGEAFCVDPADGISVFMCGGNVFPHYITPSLVTAPAPDDWNDFDRTGDYSNTSLNNAGLAIDETCPVTVYNGMYCRTRVGTLPVIPGSINVVEVKLPWNSWWGYNAVVDSDCPAFPRTINTLWANTYRDFNRYAALQGMPIDASEDYAPARLRVYVTAPYNISWATAVPAFIPQFRFISTGRSITRLGKQYWPCFQPSVSLGYDVGGNVQAVEVDQGCPDRSTMTDSFTYDAEGNMLSWAKQRGDTTETLAFKYTSGPYLDSIYPVLPSAIAIH